MIVSKRAEGHGLLREWQYALAEDQPGWNGWVLQWVGFMVFDRVMVEQLTRLPEELKHLEGCIRGSYEISDGMVLYFDDGGMAVYTQGSLAYRWDDGSYVEDPNWEQSR
jgi:hypothetical protein